MSVVQNHTTIAETLGAIQIGVLFNSFLFGIVCMQWMTYFTSKFNDSWPVRALVFWIILLDIIHVAISWEYIWMYTVENFGNFPTLFLAHWEYDCGPILIVLTAAPTQLYLVNRTRKMLSKGLGKHTLIAKGIFAFTCMLVLIEVILGLYMATGLLKGATTTAEYKEFVSVAVAWESFAIAADMTVMCSLIGTLLYRRTGFRQTDWLLYNLILVAIECAVPVTLFTIGHMTGVVASPTTAMHQLFAWSQARLYSNTLFVNLNARNKLRRGPDSVSQASGNNIREVNFLSNRSMGPQVRVDVTREEHFAMDSISNKETHTDDFKSLDQV
ncbi:hypothetical protein BT96DRAFT_272838 [Gymnopus androsaceus JB14]|uniref:DUF6534 domain-containing protein n=1 Tax=Gymnopus androsaceus JB14 TaxID=1447944 RepID=A0A6A4H2S2_9AGAR|nr:hypothetical protein BT96DRAFT_272838 [Gymnopus androsaceus JB14]